MKKIIVCIGISNSGKSTFSATTVQHNPEKYVRVNRDDIRSLLYGYNDQTVVEYYTRPDFFKMEKVVTKYEDTLIHEGLNEGKTVIIDSTNLSAEYINRYKYWNVDIELQWFDITLKEALTRNMGRARKVDESIIKKQYGKYIQLRKDFQFSFSPKIIENNMNNQSCVVFDIDGCLADNKGTRSPFDWERVGEDDPIKSVVDTFNNLNNVNDWQQFLPLYICSGRDEICREATTKWLNMHLYGIADEDYILMMRRQGDQRADWIVKQEMAEEIVKTHYISSWYDDRIQVTRHLRALGIKVFNVEYNNF